MPANAASAVPARLRPWLTLTRPANIVTAWADVLAGSAIAVGVVGFWPLFWTEIVLLLVATSGLYGGGVVLNDVFDADLDARERPERPIPSGTVGRRGAALLGVALLLSGIVAAMLVSLAAGLMAAAVAIGAVAYDAWGKHRPYLGPLNMGLCRAGNLLMGTAAVPVALASHAYVGLIPLAYIAAVTAMSRGEVHGGTRAAAQVSLVLIVAIVLAFIVITVRSTRTGFDLVPALPFFLPFVAVVLAAFVRGARQRDAASIRAAVRTGVLFLILLDASIAAGFGGFGFGLATAALLPASLGLARVFAVT